ncbi:hypothetical protein HanPI659440_Chr09g0331781 [Helianthus annuus]|nr:hypothetical protein HanPI659440_Chr09g0331781 [Helianthus annuus]
MSRSEPSEGLLVLGLNYNRSDPIGSNLQNRAQKSILRSILLSIFLIANILGEGMPTSAGITASEP